MFTVGSNTCGLITSARMEQFFGNILKDYDRMQFAYEAVKQVNRATETVSEPDFYALLRDVLAWLDDMQNDWRLCELCFRLRMQHLLGHGFNLAIASAAERIWSSRT